MYLIKSKKSKSMKKMIKHIVGITVVALMIASCSSTKKNLDISEQEQTVFEQTDKDTVAIANAESKYEIIIIEPGFYTWLNSIARPEGYYSQHFMENRNELFVLEWNRRVLDPGRYNQNLYFWQIDYDRNIDYGYDVNYKLYNYFIYIQRKYNDQLGPFLPRI